MVWDSWMSDDTVIAPTATATVYNTVEATCWVRVALTSEAMCFDKARGASRSADTSTCVNSKTASGSMTARSILAIELSTNPAGLSTASAGLCAVVAVVVCRVDGQRAHEPSASSLRSGAHSSLSTVPHLSPPPLW
jgi:hypothetical protein